MSRKILTITGVVAVVWWLALQFMERHDAPVNFLYNAVYALPPLVGAYFGFRYAAPAWGGWKSAVGKAVIFFSAGALANGGALIIWTLYNLVFKVDVPTPSAADIAWYLMYATEIASIIVLLSVTARQKGCNTLMVGLMAAAVSLLFLVFVRPLLTGTDFVTTAVNAGYLVADAVFIALILVALTLWTGHLSLFLKYALLSFGLRVVADTLFLFRLEAGTYWNGDISDLIFAVSGFLQGLAIILAMPAAVAPKAASASKV